MLYLFNSGYRTRYVRNVLNTLYLPSGSTNEYRYRFRADPAEPDHVNIDPLMIDRLKTLPRSTSVVIVFVDRFHGGAYFYHPLRQGTFVMTRESNDYMFFRVQLADYIYPRDAVGFNRVFSDRLSPHGIPRLSPGGPWSSADRYYAVVAESLFSQKDDFFFGERAWCECVEQLQKCPAFAPMEHTPPQPTAESEHPPHEKSESSGKQDEPAKPREFVFLRGVLQTPVRKPVTHDLVDDDTVFTIVRGSRYELDLAYRYPVQATNFGARATVRCISGECLTPLGDRSLNIESITDSIRFTFTTKRYLEEHRDSITCVFNSADHNAIAIGPDAKISFRIRESRLFWPQIGVALILFSAVSVFIGTDLNKITSQTLWQTLWPKGFAGLIQAGILYWLFRLIGKKIL